jgi:iron complex outermembrane receptor protein
MGNDQRKSAFRGCSAAALIMGAAMAGSVAWGQSGPVGQGSESIPTQTPQVDEASVSDIVVTARLRGESSISVPVVVTAIGATELQRRALNNFDAIARVVPGLLVGEGGSTAQGGLIAIRGIGGADTNTLGDQAVSFNIDGVQTARASVRRMSQMDIAQVEVLKGPQALFFGKNSPAGIIIVRTADPGDRFEAKLMSGHEFVAREWRNEGYVSGPVTDRLGARLAFYASNMDGWSKNLVLETSPLRPNHSRAPHQSEYAGRLTLKWEATDNFNARFKFSAARTHMDTGATANIQNVDCPLGRPQPISANLTDECKADDRVYVADVPASFAALSPAFGTKGGYFKQRDTLSGLELNYNPTEDISIASNSGYYRFSVRQMQVVAPTYNPSTLFASRSDLSIRELTQEVHVSSSFDSPVNFTFGGLYQNVKGDTFLIALRDASNPTFNNSFAFEQETDAYSAFGQVRWAILPVLELAGGGRYSKETKTLLRVRGGSLALPDVAVPDDRVSFDDFSPEITLTYRPTSRLTLFGAYKRGFLSGGFNTSTLSLAAPGSQYDQEIVKGFEGGVKALLLDGALRTNLSFFTYRVKGLQLTITVGPGAVDLRNAGSARDKGFEWDFSYRTPLDGLRLNGGVAYTHARYTDYIASCYRGQPVPECAPRVIPTSGLTAVSQDLKGGQLLRAPDWTGNVGFDYETAVGAGLKLGFNGNMSFSSSYFTDPSSKPAGRQPSYRLFDAAVRLTDANDKWEMALIGRNLTEQYYISRNSDVLFTGSNPGLPPAQSVLADTLGVVSRGREVMLRFSYRFGR